MNRTLDIELLRTFQAVARLGQFRAAAEQVHKSPAAVSVHVQRLEAIAGGRLLDRDNQSVTLTPLGERFTQHAAQVLQAHDRALGALFGAEVAGRVRFGVPDEYAAHVIRDILPGFAAAWPNVILDVTTAPSGTLRDQIARKRLHMAVTARRVAGDGDTRLMTGDPGIHPSAGRGSPPSDDVPVLASVQPVWVCGATQRAPLADPLPLALHAVGCPYGTAMTDTLNQAGRAWRVVLASPSSQAIETCVEVGLGISVVDRARVSARMRVLTDLPAIAPHEVVLLSAPSAAQMPAAAMLAGALERHFRI